MPRLLDHVPLSVPPKSAVNSSTDRSIVDGLTYSSTAASVSGALYRAFGDVGDSIYLAD